MALRGKPNPYYVQTPLFKSNEDTLRWLSRISQSLGTPPVPMTMPRAAMPFHFRTFETLDPSQITDLRKNVQMWKWLRQSRRLPMNVMANRSKLAAMDAYWRNMDLALKNWPRVPYGIPANPRYREPVLPLPFHQR